MQVEADGSTAVGAEELNGFDLVRRRGPPLGSCPWAGARRRLLRCGERALHHALHLSDGRDQRHCGRAASAMFGAVPIIDVTHSPRVREDRLHRLAEALPDAVSLAVECPEEPYDHELQPGDVEIRFHRRGSHDVGGLDVVVEVRSKWFASRAENRQERCDLLRDAVVAAAGTPRVGVHLSLPVAAWSQSV